ncbi:MAG: hypothetical protein HYT80_02725 [Euryarchaeota archaeon]|nr:hypothetical protein [Euryarchaeota archaeon]
MRFEGSFTLFIWGTYANVTDADGQTSYRSGSWDDNVVGGQARPRGVARDSHSQILRLTVLEGQLRLEDWAGKIRVAGDAAATETDGQAILDDATGYLESNEFAYTAKQETFKVSGFVSLAIDGAAGSSTRLAVELRGESADTSLPPAGRIPVAAADRVAKVPAAESSTTSSEGFTLATSEMGVRDVLLWSLAGIVVPIVGYRLGARRRARNKDAIVPPEGPVYAGPSPLLQAEEALVRGEPEAARALVKGVLAKDPKDMDAWFVHGASLIRQGSFREAVRDLEAVARQSSAAQPGLAFLLCMAFVGLRKVGKARRWAKVASMEPDFKRQIEMDEAFATLRGPPTAGPAPMIREGATFDPAYG